MAKEFKENWDAIANYWNTKVGLGFFYFIFLSIYYGALRGFIEENIFEAKLYTVWLIPGFFLVIIYGLWAYFSYRFSLFKTRLLTTGIFLRCNDTTAELRIKEVINDMVDELKEEFREIKFKLFPINYVPNKSQMIRYVASKNHILDNAFYGNIYSGNCVEDSQTVSKIEIQDIFFSAHLNTVDPQDFRARIDLSSDLSLRNLNKDWQYLESKSFSEKLKLKHNLKDSLLFFNGLYAIYKKEYDLALKIFKALKKSESEEYDLVAAAKRNRLNEILLGLFTFNAIEKYLINKELESAFLLLKECETIFQNNHRFSFSNYITLSRMYFEKGDLRSAKEYTGKAREINKSHAAIHCNVGFFGMVENNPELLHYNYRELAHAYRYRGTINFIEIVHFIELHKVKYIPSIHLFNFAIAVINFLYVDKALGREQLIASKDVLRSNLSCGKLHDLTLFLLQKGEIRSPYFQRDRRRRVG